MSDAHFADFAALCESLAATAGKLERTRLVSEYLAGLSPGEAETATRWLVGRTSAETEGRRLSLGGRAVWDAAQAAGASAESLQWAGSEDFGEVVRRAVKGNDGPALRIDDLRDAFAAIAASTGAGSRRARVDALTVLFRRATPLEAKYIAKIVVGEMRHGVQEGIVLDAIARLAGVSGAAVRRAQQAIGDLGRLASVAKTDPSALASTTARLFYPLKPMLAQSVPDVAAAFRALDGRLALEWKLDGARVQIHKRDGEVKIFSRRLQNLTASLPDVAAVVVANTAATSAIFEGEVIAVDAEGEVLPFQELMRRFRRVRDIEAVAAEVPVRLHLFDLLYEGDEWLLDQPMATRWSRLEKARGGLDCLAHVEPSDVAAGERFYAAALEAGHEGVMAKALDAPYTPGVRGTSWLKVKHSVTVDLAIIAADWGYGRRHRWLSNYHLAARDAATGDLEPVGKTFKGPTDAGFQQLTDRLLALRIREERGTVYVRPEIVVEVRFEGVQRSPQYPCGMALRFARIVRVRDDKGVDDVDTVETLRTLP